MAPKNFKELEEMLEFAINLNKPVVIRYPRGGEDEYKIEKQEKLELGKAEIIKEGKDLTIIAIGNQVAKACKVAKRIEEEQKKITVEVINARFLKPMDQETIKKSIEKTKNVITIEDGTILNGLATAVQEIILQEQLESVKIKNYAYPDEYIRTRKSRRIRKKVSIRYGDYPKRSKQERNRRWKNKYGRTIKDKKIKCVYRKY